MYNYKLLMHKTQRESSKRMVEEIAKQYNISLKDASILLTKSETFYFLMCEEHSLWEQSLPCLMHVFNAEMNGDKKEFEKYIR